LRRREVVAVASSGGHWAQLRRLAPAFAGRDVTWITTDASLHGELTGEHLHVVPDASAWDKKRALYLALRVALLMLWLRPRSVVTTGAAPGYFAIRFSRLLGARTVWIDSLANADELSRSGRMIGPKADLWLTQWPHLAEPAGPAFEGSLL
jgi:exopolysaccharide biosynthesis glucuronosyltransferase PssD